MGEYKSTNMSNMLCVHGKKHFVKLEVTIIYNKFSYRKVYKKTTKFVGCFDKLKILRHQKNITIFKNFHWSKSEICSMYTNVPCISIGLISISSFFVFYVYWRPRRQERYKNLEQTMRWLARYFQGFIGD